MNLSIESLKKERITDKLMNYRLAIKGGKKTRITKMPPRNAFGVMKLKV